MKKPPTPQSSGLSHRMRARWHRIRKSPAYRRSRWLTYPLIAIIALTLIVIVLTPVIFPPRDVYNFGVSFSTKRAAELDLDYKANFTALLDDLKIEKYRLMSYWDEHEKTRGQLNFESLDWQMDEAAKRGATVSLAIGLRQPRWPECHQPAWADTLSGNEWKQALYAYIEIVVNRYKDHPALESWQLENEYFNTWFGLCDTPDRERFNEEYALVKKLSSKPVLISLADQHGYPSQGPVGDAMGYSVYRFVYNDKIIKGYLWYPSPVWYHRLRAGILTMIWNKPMFVHELQLEPWGPVDTKDLTEAEQDASMSNDQIRSNVRFARSIGFEDVYTWGAEWWYWRREKHGDYTLWDTIKREVESSKISGR